MPAQVPFLAPQNRPRGHCLHPISCDTMPSCPKLLCRLRHRGRRPRPRQLPAQITQPQQPPCPAAPGEEGDSLQPRAVVPRLAVFGVGAVLWKSTGSSPPLAARPADDSRLEECLGQTLWSQFLRTMKSSLWTLNLQPAGSGCRCPGLCKVSAGDCPWGGQEANAWGCYWGEALGSQAAFSMTFAGQRCFGVVSDRPCRSDFTCTSMSFLK